MLIFRYIRAAQGICRIIYDVEDINTINAGRLRRLAYWLQVCSDFGRLPEVIQPERYLRPGVEVYNGPSGCRWEPRLLHGETDES